MRFHLIVAAASCLIASGAFAQTSSTPPSSSTTTPSQAQPPNENQRGMPGMGEHRGMMRGEGREEGEHGAMEHGMGRGMGRGMGMMGGGGMMRMMSGSGPFFAFRSAQGRFMVKCPENESMKACVDAIMPLFDKLQSMHQTQKGQP
jgi:hypothetical protein